MESASKISMSPEIIIEAKFMLQALFLGMILLFLYELLSIIRQVFPHGRFVLAAEDLLYWSANTFLIFKLLFKYNFGIIRWFVILGVCLGMLICKAALGKNFVTRISRKIKAFFHNIGKKADCLRKYLSKYVKILEKRSDK